jgi:hypothetical protein
MEQRDILSEWVEQTIRLGSKYESQEDEVHFTKKIFENNNNELEVVVNPINKIIVTVWWNE